MCCVAQVFRAMKKSGFEPEKATFNTLIEAYGRCGSSDQAMGIYDGMLQAGCTPDLATFNTLLATLAREGRWEHAELVLDELKRSSYKPNDIAYASMLHAYTNGGELEKMNELVDTLRTLFVPITKILLKTLVLVYRYVEHFSDHCVSIAGKNLMIKWLCILKEFLSRAPC